MQDGGTSSALVQVMASLRRFAPLAFVLTVIAVHVLVAARSVGPMYLFDEVGYLAGAHVIAGEGGEWSLCGSSYAVGYSAVLAPLWWLPISPLAVYQIAAVLSALIGAAVMWPATLLARVYGATRWPSLLIGALVTLVPARALLDNYVIAENPLTLVVVGAALYAHRLVARPTASAHVAFGVLAGSAGALHARAYPLVAVALAWGVLRAIRRGSRWSHAFGAALPLVVIATTGYIGMRIIGREVFPNDSRTDDLFAGTNLTRLAEVVSGQLFTQVVSWSLLVLLGVFVMARPMWQAIRVRRLDAVMNPLAYIGGSALLMAVATVVLLASAPEYAERLDIPIFGRYLDPFLVPVVISGLAAFVDRRERRFTTAAALSATGVVLAYVIAVLPRIGVDETWIPFAVPGLLPVLDPLVGDDRPYLLIAAALALATCAAWWLLRRKPIVALVGAVLIAATVTTVTDMRAVDSFEEQVRARSPLYGYINGFDDLYVAFAAEEMGCAARNKLQFELAGQVELVPAGGDYGTQLVIGPAPEWPLAQDRGYERVPLTMWNSAAVWVYSESLDSP